MGTKFFTCVVLFASVLSSVCFSYSGGLGTDTAPYEINTPADWQQFMNTSADWNKHFILTADINLAGLILKPIAADTDASTGGFQGTMFTGIFDGNGHVIRNAGIYKPSSEYVGLFGYVGEGGQIRDLGVEGINVVGHERVGGVCGDNDGTITSCYATGSVNGDYEVGGLCGVNDYGTITSCRATGLVTGTGWYAGGLCGWNDGTLISCYATGQVTGKGAVGGLCGENDGAILSCYATGLVTGTEIVGGLCGDNYGGTITHCYATGAVTGNEEVGGLCGDDHHGRLTSCFWDIGTSGTTDGVGNIDPDPAGVIGKTTLEMKMQSIFTDAGWDFIGESANGLHDFWQIAENDYPRFTVHTWTLSGDGTSDNPYMVADANDLSRVWLRPFANYRLDSDIDLSGISWSTPIVPALTGVFDGNGYVIRNAVINLPDSDYVGLFGSLGSSGQIRNLAVEDITITGYDYVGGLCGRNNGSIISCYSTGKVTGISYVGGLCGWNDGWVNFLGSITSCYAAGKVTGTRHVGGLCGTNVYGTISQSYATGAVTGTGDYVGGLCGDNDYGTITASFWDIQTSGKTTSAGRQGKTTLEMQTQSTFTSAGWDFVGESVNGTADRWRMCVDGIDYPKLNWQYSFSGDLDCPNGVGIEDLLYLAGRWLETTAEPFDGADVTGDKRVNISDFTVLSGKWP